MFTQTDIDRLDSAIGSGTLTVRNANGEMVTYRSLAELMAARALMVRAVSPGRTAYVTPTYGKGV